MTPILLVFSILLPAFASAQSTYEWTNLSPGTIEQLEAYEAEKVGSTTISFFPISTFVLWTSMYIMANVLEWGLTRWTKEFPRMSFANQRTCVMYILSIFYTTVVFALQMACTGIFISHYTVTNIHCIMVAATMITTLYLFELTYRSVMRLQMLMHHFCTVFAVIFVIACLQTTQDPSLFVTGLCWIFQASTEQVQFAGLLMYRFKCSPRAVSSTLRFGAAQALFTKMCSSIYVFIWWGQRQARHTHPTEIAFSVILVLAMSCLMVTQFYGSYVVWILSNSYEKKYFAGDAARLGDRDGAETPGSVETREKILLDGKSMADTRSVILERGGVRKLGLRPPSLASALRRAETVFDLPIGSVALEVSFGGMWVEVLEDGWDSTVLSVQDPLALKVVDTIPATVHKRRRSAEAEQNDGHVCSKAREEDDGRAQASSSRGAVKAKEKGRDVSSVASPRASSLRSAATRSPTSSIAAAPPVAVSPSSRDDDKITLHVKAYNFFARDFVVRVAPSIDVSKIKSAFARAAGGGRLMDDYRFEYNDELFCGTVAENEMKDGDTIEAFLGQTGGKPVIYLFPPTPLATVRVDLTLVPQWTFSAVYPVVPISRAKAPHGGSTASWTVSASPSGDLIETSSGLSLSYLFWEAHTTSTPPSPLLLPTTSQIPAFNPANTTLTPSTALALPFSDFLPYLDSTLSTLTLHTSARNDFITYWLPKFIAIRDRGQRIAFRFVEQAAYEQAARLAVDPKPDVVTRVFMTFEGVEMDGVEWKVDGKGAEEVDWRDVVGIESAASDESKFRVLELGGMELLH
ncbi:hypothetical protein RQP46_001425 [Phenoliferia psychrophenolica]